MTTMMVLLILVERAIEYETTPLEVSQTASTTVAEVDTSRAATRE